MGSANNNFMKAMEFVLTWEVGPKGSKRWDNGGYVNNPADPGGETKYGISKRAHPEEDIKNLTLARALELYKEFYWDANACDEIPMPKAIAVMDTKVQFSYATCKMLLRQDATWEEIVQRRKEFRGERVKAHPESQQFLAGWLNRDNDLAKFCKIWEQDNK